MDKADNILIVESECEIIKPIFIKNRYNKELSPESKDSKNDYINDEENEDNLDNIINHLNKAILLNMVQDNKKHNPILEILNILRNPIDPNHKPRYIPNDTNSNLFNNEIENNLKYVKDININNKKDFYDNNISNVTKSLTFNRKLRKKL